MKTFNILLFAILLSVYSINAQNTADYSQNDRNNGDCNCDASYEGYNWYGTPMNPKDFSELKSFIGERWFESSKMEFAKSAIDENYFTTGQVRELLGLFSFESSKMELAKYVYNKTVDKGNFFKLYDVFWFESSITELHNFVKSQQ